MQWIDRKDLAIDMEALIAEIQAGLLRQHQAMARDIAPFVLEFRISQELGRFPHQETFERFQELQALMDQAAKLVRSEPSEWYQPVGQELLLTTGMKLDLVSLFEELERATATVMEEFYPKGKPRKNHDEKIDMITLVAHALRIYEAHTGERASSTIVTKKAGAFIDFVMSLLALVSVEISPERCEKVIQNALKRRRASESFVTTHRDNPGRSEL